MNLNLESNYYRGKTIDISEVRNYIVNLSKKNHHKIWKMNILGTVIDNPQKGFALAMCLLCDWIPCNIKGKVDYSKRLLINAANRGCEDAAYVYSVVNLYYPAGEYGCSKMDAFKHMVKVAEYGNVLAQYRVGTLYDPFEVNKTVDVKKLSATKAKMYYSMAAKNGCPNAKFALGRIQFNEGEYDIGIRTMEGALESIVEGKERDIPYVKVMQSDLKRFQKELDTLRHSLYSRFIKGDYSPETLKEAERRSIAGMTDVLTDELLGRLFSERAKGEDVEINAARSRACYGRAMNKGSAIAPRILAMEYNDRTSPQYNPSEARRLFELASKRGDTQATIELRKFSTY